MNLETFNNKIKEFVRLKGSRPKTIHLSGDESIEFVKNIDDLLFGFESSKADKIKYNLLARGEFPEELTAYGVKILFSQPNKTVLY